MIPCGDIGSCDSSQNPANYRREPFDDAENKTGSQSFTPIGLVKHGAFTYRCGEGIGGHGEREYSSGSEIHSELSSRARTRACLTARLDAMACRWSRQPKRLPVPRHCQITEYVDTGACGAEAGYSPKDRFIIASLKSGCERITPSGPNPALATARSLRLDKGAVAMCYSFIDTMNLSRPSRFFAALVTLFCLLFTQLAIAAYVCPQPIQAPVSVTANAETADMPDCSEMDAQQRNLCHAHCAEGKQSLDTPAAPHVGAFVASTLVCVLHGALLPAPILLTSSAALPLQRATAPPIAIRNCCFLI